MEQANDNKAPDVVVTIGADGKPVCTPETVRPKGANAVLKFKLAAAGYAFPTSGAVVVSGGSVEFPEPSRTTGPHDSVALLRDVNSDSGSYQYTVTVRRASDGQLLRVDPTIQNGDK